MNLFLTFSSVYTIDILFIFQVHPPVYSNTLPCQTISNTLTMPTPTTIAYSYQLYNTVHYYLCNGQHPTQLWRTGTMHCSSKHCQIHGYTHSDYDVVDQQGPAVSIATQYTYPTAW